MKGAKDTTSNNTLSSSQLSALLLGSTDALPTTGGTSNIKKDWSNLRGAQVIKHDKVAEADSWERSGKGLDVVEASQLLRNRVKETHRVSSSRYRRTEGKGGREAVVRNYELLIKDLSRDGDGDKVLSKTEHLDSAQLTSKFHKSIHPTDADLIQRGNADSDLMGKRLRSDVLSSESSHGSSGVESTEINDNCRNPRHLRRRLNRSSSFSSTSTSSSSSESSFDSRTSASEKIGEDENDSVDEIDARRNRARLKARQRQSNTGSDVSSTKVSTDSKERTMNRIVNCPSIMRKTALSSNSSLSQAKEEDSDLDSTSSSSSSSFSEEELDQSMIVVAPTNLKPTFIPKHLRLKDLDAAKKEQEAEEMRMKEEARKLTEIQQSRALLASVLADKNLNSDRNMSLHDDGLGEFSEVCGSNSTLPDDTDDCNPIGKNGDAGIMTNRDAWEVRELLRILREFEEQIVRHQDKNEKRRLEGANDRYCNEEVQVAGNSFPENHRSSRQNQLENRQDPKQKSLGLQRYYHRGAFYMDEDTLAESGKQDVRHRAAEYARAATGEDKIDKSKLPEIMQVKKFGFGGYSTKYKGLAKEDTTDRKLQYIPLVKTHKKDYATKR